MLLQKQLKFQNIPVTTFTFTETQKLYLLFQNFEPKFFVPFYFFQKYFYLYKFFLEGCANLALYTSIIPKNVRSIRKVTPFHLKSLPTKLLMVGTVSSRTTNFSHPNFLAHRNLFLKKSLPFTRFWVQRRYRFRSFMTSKVLFPSVQVLRRRRRKKWLNNRRQARKLFFKKVRNFFFKTRVLLNMRRKPRLIKLKRAKRFLQSPFFLSKILRSHLKNSLLLSNNYSFFFKKATPTYISKVLLYDVRFLKTLLRSLRRYFFLFMGQRRLFKNSFFRLMSRAENRAASPCGKVLSLKSLYGAGLVNRSYDSIFDCTNATTTELFLGLRQFLRSSVLNNLSRSDIDSDKSTLESRLFRTVRGGRVKVLRTPRMTSYFSLRARRFNLSLTTPIFLTLLQKATSLRCQKFLKRTHNPLRPLSFKSVFKAKSRNKLKKLKSSQFWPNRLLRRKFFQSKILNHLLTRGKKKIKKKLKFRRKLHHYLVQSQTSPTSLAHLSRIRKLSSSYSLRNYSLRTKPPTTISPKLQPLFTKVTSFLRFEGTNTLIPQEDCFEPQPLSNVIFPFVKSFPVTKSRSLHCFQKHSFLARIITRRRRSRKWKRSKRFWYTLQTKVFKRDQQPKKSSLFPKRFVGGGEVFRSPGYFVKSKNRRRLLVKPLHHRRRRFLRLKKVLRHYAHLRLRLILDNYTRVITKRRQSRRRRRFRRNRNKSSLWTRLYRPILNKYPTIFDTTSSHWARNSTTFPFKNTHFKQRLLQLNFLTQFYQYVPEVGASPRLVNRPTINSWTKKPFILSEVGFLYGTSFKLSLNPRNYASLKVIKYSFYDLMFLKRAILKTKKPLFYFKRRYFSDNLLHNNLLRTHPYLFALKSFTAHSQAQPEALHVGFSSHLTHDFDTAFLEGEDDYYIRIKRIRFKPGYPRLWREARSDFNTLFNLNFRYQHRLTQYVNRYSRYASALKTTFLDLKIKTMLLRFWWIFDPLTAVEVITNQLVFLNGTVVNNANKLIFRGDLIQLIVHLKYYIVHRWLLNWYYFKSNRKARLAKSKFKRVQQAQMKQKSFLLPDWLLRTKLVDLEIPRFVEIDFFSLSAFMLYNPSYGLDYQLLDTLDSRFEIYSMYNWKYIT